MLKNKHKKFVTIGSIFIAVGVIMICLGFYFLEGSGITDSGKIAMVFFIIGAIITIVGLVFRFIALDNSRKYCDACGESLNGCAYEYQAAKANVYNNGDYSVKVHIRAKCPKCGTVKEFDEKFYCNCGENVGYKVETYMREHYGDRL